MNARDVRILAYKNIRRMLEFELDYLWEMNPELTEHEAGTLSAIVTEAGNSFQRRADRMERFNK